MPLITIITVVYNNVNQIEKTIQSVLNQRNANYEYIVIDGGSKDGTIDIISKYQHSIAYFVSEKDSGIYEAMNKGWRKASGDYCLFLNSGDFFFNDNVLHDVQPYLEKKNADILYGSLYAFDEKQNWITEFPENISLYFLLNNFLPHPATFFRTEIIKKNNGYNEKYKIIADWIFYIQAFLSGMHFLRMPITITAFYMKGLSANGELNQMEREVVFKNELSFLSQDVDNFRRLQHFDTSKLTRAAIKLSRVKQTFLNKL